MPDDQHPLVRGLSTDVREEPIDSSDGLTPALAAGVGTPMWSAREAWRNATGEPLHSP